ncbi:hypothetical protein PICMEDRAFT_52883, partial [Pichia membranifaciens NRRL Y-2026]
EETTTATAALEALALAPALALAAAAESGCLRSRLVPRSPALQYHSVFTIHKAHFAQHKHFATVR